MNQAMDMVTMNILEQAMVSICRQMGITLMKTSYSTIFNEALDFTCGIASPDGNMISVAEFNPAHIGAMNVLMRSCLQEISSDVEPGDVIVHNDPYRGGLHTPEHTFYKPIFVDGELMAFAVAIGHIAEIGGLVPGAFASEATEIFHEGLRIPPVRIRRRGEDVADVWKLLLAPVRTPRQNYGDYRALISAVDLGERELTALIRKYGQEVFTRTILDLQDYSETRMRAELRDLPDGSYTFEDIMEDDGTEAGPFTIKVECFIQGDEIIVDFTGTSPQAVGPINATLGVTHSATYNALFHLTDPSIPKNAGCFRPIKIIAPPGTIVNVDYPAPSVGGNTETHPRIAYTVIGALAQCVGERGFAADGGSHSNFVFGAVDARTGDYVACYDLMVAGWGGRSYADGNSAANVINGNNRMTPTEVFEMRYPWRVEHYGLVPDSGGTGKYRGGLGTTKTLLCMNPTITVSFFGDRQKRGPWGLHGGSEGGRGKIEYLLSASQAWQPMHSAFGKRSQSKFAATTVRLGDRVRITTPGAGGWGSPQERDPAMIGEDLNEGFTTSASSKMDYGHSNRS